MTIPSRDHQGRFTRTQDAARIATAAEHIEPVRRSPGAAARAYEVFQHARPQDELDAEDRGSPWVKVIVLGCAALTCLGVAVMLAGML